MVRKKYGLPIKSNPIEKNSKTDVDGINVENPRISVVIPAYNCSKYITKAMDSVCSQTVKPYELIIVDDGSTDNTRDVIDGYIKHHNVPKGFINLLCRRNGGAGEARNTGIRNAAGDWIAFLDSDDEWNERKVELVIKKIRCHPEYDIITHDEKWHYHNRKGKKDKIHALHKKYVEDKNLFVQLYEGNFLSTSCMVIKKSLFDLSGDFDTSLQPAEDYDMWIRLSKYAKLLFINNPLTTYIVRNDSISSAVKKRYDAELHICIKYFDDLKQYVGKRNARIIAVRRMIMIHRVEIYHSFMIKDFRLMLLIFILTIPNIKRICWR